MATPPEDVSRDQPEVGSAQHRPLRFSPESPAADVLQLVAGSGELRDERILDPLGQSLESVHQRAVVADLEDSSEDSDGQGRSSDLNPVLADGAFLAATSTSGSRAPIVDSGDSSSNDESSDEERTREADIDPRKGTTSRVEATRGALTEHGVPLDVATKLAELGATLTEADTIRRVSDVQRVAALGGISDISTNVSGFFRARHETLTYGREHNNSLPLPGLCT